MRHRSKEYSGFLLLYETAMPLRRSCKQREEPRAKIQGNPKGDSLKTENILVGFGFWHLVFNPYFFLRISGNFYKKT